MPPSLLAYPYQFARTPFVVFDVALARRLPKQSAVRRSFDRAFGTIDLLAGRLLADDTLLRQGAERIGAMETQATRPATSDNSEVPAAGGTDAEQVPGG